MTFIRRSFLISALIATNAFCSQPGVLKKNKKDSLLINKTISSVKKYFGFNEYEIKNIDKLSYEFGNRITISSQFLLKYENQTKSSYLVLNKKGQLQILSWHSIPFDHSNKFNIEKNKIDTLFDICKEFAGEFNLNLFEIESYSKHNGIFNITFYSIPKLQYLNNKKPRRPFIKFYFDSNFKMVGLE